MSTNEVGSITRQQLKRNQEQSDNTINSENSPEIEVFASDNVSARVNLNADETNSLFENTTLHATRENGALSVNSDTQAVTELPDDIKQRFPSQKDQEALKNLSEAQLEQARKLMDTRFSGQNISQIVQIFKPEQVDKIKQQATEMEELSGGKENVYMMALGNDKYDQSAYTLSALNFDLSLKTNVLNKDLTTRSIEDVTEHTTEDGKKYRERNAYDLGTNTLSKTRYDYDEKNRTYVTSYEIRSKIRDDGSMVSRELIKPSSVAGIYDIEVLTEDGVKDVSSVKQRKNGRTTVRKDMESPDGTRTEYLYRDTPDGNRYSRYKITDKDGNVLMNNTKSFKVVDENTFTSSFNDESYTMTVSDNILTVKSETDETKTAQIDLSAIQGNKEELIPILKQMSGDQLIALSKTTDKLVGIDSVIESYYSAKTREIHSGDDMFVVLHEEGHAKDFQTLNLLDMLGSESTMISRDDDLYKVFNQEKQAFNQAFPDAQREHIDYFINTLTHYGGYMGGLQETVAESNAILETPRSHEMLGLRTQYLQQYFPKTIAKLNELLSEDRQRAEQKMRVDFPEIKIPEIEIPDIEIPEIEGKTM